MPRSGNETEALPPTKHCITKRDDVTTKTRTLTKTKITMKRQNHNMRTYFTRFVTILFLMLGVAGQMSAAEQTFTMSSQGWNNGAEATTLSGTGFSVSWDKGSSSNAPKYYTSGTAVRAYGGNTITITAKTGYTVSGVTFAFGSSDGSNAITANTGTFTSPNWSGSLAAGSSVVFTIGGTSGNRRISAITVTYASTSTPTVSLNKTETSIVAGETEMLTAETTNPTGAAVTWTTNNSNVATVSGGTVTAVALGTATITAALSSNPSIKATCAVTVTAISRTITIDDSDMDLTVGGASQTRTGTLSAGTGTIAYESDDDDVATVDADGTVHPVGEGSCTITASVPAVDNYAAASASYTVNVTDPNKGTINFDKDHSGNGYLKITGPSVSGNDTAGNTWSITTTGTNPYFGPKTGYYQVGSNNNPATSITFTMSLSQNVNFKTFKAMFGGTGDTNASYTMKVDDNVVKTFTITSSNKTATEYSMPSPVSGRTLTIVVTGSKVIANCYYISYTLETGTVPTFTPSSISSQNLVVGETYQTSAISVNSGGALSAESADEDVATVSWNNSTKKATVTAVGEGETTIKIKATANGNYLAGELPFMVNVVAPTISLNKNSTTLEIGGTEVLTVTTTNAGGATINWSTSDGTKVSLSGSGNTRTITGVAAGSSTITASITVNGHTYSAECTVTVSAPVPASDGDYIKVTSAPDDWTGTYLIVYESGSLAMNGGLTTLDASGNSIAVTITDDKIAANSTNDAASFNIASDDEGGWTIKSKSGYYIGSTKDANELNSSTSISYTNTLSLDVDKNAVIQGESSIMRYNKTSGQERFRYFKAATYTVQQPIALYKRKVALDGTKTTGTASFGTTNKTLAVGDSWTNTLTTNSSGTPTYSSSNSAIVSVDENTGEITAVAVGGPVTITVNIPETPVYTAVSATYTVTVVSAEADGSYVLVESEPADWSGTYLIVNADEATAGSGIALDGSLDASSLSASGNGRSVTIAAKKIPATASTNASSFVVAKSGDVYSLKSASGLFIGRDAASNGMDTSSETAYLNTLSLTSDGVVEIVGEGGKHIAYNSSVATFKYYSMAANVYLYKKTSTSGDELISTTVTFDEPKTLIKKVGDTWTKTATTNSSARPHYSSSDAKIVKVVNATTGEMKALKTGIVTIMANVPENEVYTSAEDSYIVTVNKGDNDLALTSSSAVTLGTSTSAYTITYSTSSTGTITWNSSDETIATVAQGSGKTGIVTLTGNVGTVTITFSQGADEDYEASTGSQSVTITVSTSGSNVAYYYRLSGGTVPTGATGTKYLLVCEDKGKAADSYTLGALVNAGDVTGKRRSVPVLDVTIVDDRIEATTRLDQAMYLFTGSGSEFQLKSSRNTYIGDTDFQGCSKPEEVTNGLSEVDEDGYFVGTSEVAPAMYNTVTIEEGNLVIEGGGLAPSVGGTTVHRYLRYNEGSAFFRYYRYDSGVQQKLALYKRATSSDKYVQFVPHSKELEVGETWATTIYTQNTTGTPTYESMNPAVAIVDPNTGVITAISSGTADVKVTVDGVENYANVSVKSSGALLSRYIKMTNTSDLVNGDYLVVYESSETEGYLMDGSLKMSNNTPVAKTTTNAIIEDDKDQTNYPGAKCIGATPTIDTGNFIFAMKYSGADVYHTVRSHSGYYIGKQASADGLDVTTGSPFNNVLTAPGSSTSFKGEGTTYLKYNTTDENFQFYTTGQSVIQLYKKIPYNYELYAGSVTPRIQKADVAGPGLLAPNAIAIYNLSSTVAANETLMENIKNEPNVVVNGTTQSFVLSDYKEEDGAKTYYPFYAPLSSAGSDKSFTAAAVSYSRPNAGGWNSVCLPFSIPFEKVTELFGADSKVYQLTGVNAEHNVVFTELTDEMDPVPAGEPVLVYSKDDTWNATNVAGSFSIKGDVAGRKVVRNATTTETAEIIGTYSTLIPGTVDGSTLYKLKADGTSFGTMSATAKVYPFRMYIKYTPPTAQSAPANLPVKIHVIEGTIGDLNKDKMATLSDLTMMINMVNGVEEKTNAADLDGDGDVNGVDVNRLAKILTKSK